jgi:hypothetical protein
MRLIVLQSFMNKKPTTYQVSSSHHDLFVSKRPSRFLLLVVPHVICNQWVHPLMNFIFSLEFVSVLSPLYARTHSTSSMRFRSSSRHQLKQSTYRELPSSHVVPFSVFRTLSTVCSCLSLLSLFHPKATSKIRFPRVFPTTKHSRLITACCPLSISEVRLL